MQIWYYRYEVHVIDIKGHLFVIFFIKLHKAFEEMCAV